MSQWLTRMSRRVRALLHPGALDRDLDAEMRFHLEMEAEDLMRTRGLAPEEARRQALIAFGGVERYKEEHRDARGVRWVEGALQDARYAARALRRSVGFTLSSVLVLALGIGSTTAVFSAVNAVLLDPKYDRLVIIFQQFSPTSRGTLSVVDFRAIEDQQRSFSAVGALRWREAAFSAGGEPERVRIGAATSGFFRALGVRPARGRAIEPGDERQGAPPVALVSQALAVRALGGEVAAVGRSITVDGIAYTVVGVLPAGVRDLAGVRAQVWPALQLEQPTRRGPFGLRVVGRLATGVTLDAATRDLAGISERIFPLWASSFQQRSARLTPVPIRTALLTDATKMLGMFSAAVGLVLLIAVANVASLMLVRAVGRWRELSLRTVLGATRVRLVRLLVTESIVLAAAGAAAGIVLGALGLQALIAIGPRMPQLAAAHLDLRAAAFGVAVALLAGTIVGAYPVALLLRRNPTGALQSGDRTMGAGRHTHALRSAFVVAQFALALPLLVIAGLLLNSFLRLQRVDPGFDPQHVLTVRISLPEARYSGDSLVADSLIAGYWARALPRLSEIPGVSAVGVGSSMPPNDDGWSLNNFDLIDHPVAPGASQPVSPWLMVNTAYFTALGVPLLEGRLFTPADSGGPAPVVAVSRSWARHYFPEGNVVGRKLISAGCLSCPPITVVGVVGDVRYEGLNGTRDAVYEPLAQEWQRDLNVFVRTAASPTEVAGRVRAALRSVDPAVPLDDVAPMEARIDDSVAQPRHWTMLLGSFAVAALTLAAVGIFGMLSYMVSTRRREIGVRMALGAQGNAVVALIVRRGMGHALAGAAIGLAAAILGARWLESALFDVSATDPTTLAAVTLLLLSVALIASWLPARRAAAVNPVEAIRLE